MWKWLTISAKVAITAALIYFAVGRANFALIGERLDGLRVGWISIALAIPVLQLLLGSIRWQIIARRCDAPISLLAASHLNLIGSFFNQVLPSNIGGDAVRIWLFARRGAGWSKATYSVLLDRFIGLLSLAILVTICLPWSLTSIQNLAGRVSLLVIGVGTVAAAVLVVSLGQFRLDYLQQWQATRHLTALSRMASIILLSRQAGTSVLALSLAVHGLTVAAACLIAFAVSTPLEFGQALILIPPVMLVTAVPISIAGWGVRESALVLAFSYVGLHESDGLIVSVLLGASTLVLGIAGGIAWWVTGELAPPKQPLAAQIIRHD